MLEDEFINLNLSKPTEVLVVGFIELPPWQFHSELVNMQTHDELELETYIKIDRFFLKICLRR